MMIFLVNPSSIETWIDDSIIEVDITIRDETGLLIVLIWANDLKQKLSGAFYKLDLLILDKNDNKDEYTYYFLIVDITTPSETNTVSLSNTTSTKNTNDSNIFVNNIEMVVFLSLVAIIMFLTYKNYKL